MTDFLKWLTDLISHLGNWGYFLIALIAFLEAIPLFGWLIPGVVILIFGGFLVTENVFDFFDLIVICSIFTFLGDMAAFAWGRRFAGSFKKEHKIMKESYLIKAKDFIKRRGTSGIFFGRFIAPVRSTLYFVLGLIKMPWFKFVIPVAISSFVFTFFYVGVGYLAGNAWQTIGAWSGRLAILVLGVLIILAFLWWLKGWLVKQGKQLRELIATALKTFFIWYQTTSWWKKFAKDRPLASRKILRLSNPNDFFGLPLSALWLTNIILVLTIFYYALLANKVNSFLAELDHRLQLFISLFSEPHLAVVMFLITMFGSAYFIAASTLVFSIWLWLEKKKSYVISLWLVIAGTFLSGSLIKFIIARPRPLPTFFFENSYAFPSLHAAMALVFLMFLTYYAIKTYPRWSRSISLVLVAIFMILVIGFSRIYLGVHYFSDVLGGYLLGTFWFILGVIVQKSLAQLDKPHYFSKLFKIIFLSGAIILISGIYFSQILKTSDIKANFFYALSSATNKKTSLINANGLSSDLLVTENLRGARRRPVNFIFKAQPQTLKEVLIKAGWVERLEPSLLNFVRRGTSTLFKIPYLDAPLRPRFWNNEPNSLTFTKLAPRNEQIDSYVLRLWPAEASVTNKPVRFIAELAINKDYSWNSLSKQEIFKLATTTLLSDLMASNNFSHLETSLLEVNLGDEEKDNVTTTLYSIDLK